MPICKLSFAKSRSVADPACGTGAPEVPRNEACREVRRSASGPEGRGMRVTQQIGVLRQPRRNLIIDLPMPVKRNFSLFSTSCLYFKRDCYNSTILSFRASPTIVGETRNPGKWRHIQLFWISRQLRREMTNHDIDTNRHGTWAVMEKIIRALKNIELFLFFLI